MNNETIDSRECAELLRATKAPIQGMARGGDLPALRSRSWLFVRQDLRAYLAEKARAEAQERRSKRQPGAAVPITRLRRQAAHVLPGPTRLP